jgi:2-amino-4-hydroxy-6-hydroxymethyldihydropteridine diphosphokinase
MSLVIATGSNLGDKLNNLRQAKLALASVWNLTAESRIYCSAAVDYENQPDFFNQVLEFNLPNLSPEKAMTTMLEIEQQFGRSRDIPKGPRMIDIIFWGHETHHTNHVTIPHPRWLERSFVVRPLQELPFFKSIEKCFTIPRTFQVEAFPI